MDPVDEFSIWLEFAPSSGSLGRLIYFLFSIFITIFVLIVRLLPSLVDSSEN